MAAKLRHGNYAKAIGHNISYLLGTGMPTKQAQAVALSTAKGSTITGRGPGARSAARVSYMRGFRGIKYNPRLRLRQVAYQAGQAARSGKRPLFAYPSVGPNGPNPRPPGRNAGSFERRHGQWVKGKGGRFVGSK